MNIDSLLEQIENILDSGTKITLSKKTAVNAEEIRECVEHLREIIPEEVDQAKSITANRNEIIEKAKRRGRIGCPRPGKSTHSR